MGDRFTLFHNFIVSNATLFVEWEGHNIFENASHTDQLTFHIYQHPIVNKFSHDYKFLSLTSGYSKSV